MFSLSQIMVLGTVFGFTLTIVNLLPPMLVAMQSRIKIGQSQISREFDKFFVNIRATHLLAIVLTIGGIVGWLTDSAVLGIAIALVGAFVPRVALSIWKGIRTTQFDGQLMDALILINNALKSGLDVTTGIELVSTNMTPPISEEFGLVVNSFRLGARLDDALMSMTQRVQSRILDTTISAINIQRESGGNLVKTFEQLIQTIRDEAKLQKKVRALSAQGRMQVVILAIIPWILGGFFYAISPDFMNPVLSQPWGQAVLAGLIIWEGIGILVTKNIVTVDV